MLKTIQEFFHAQLEEARSKTSHDENQLHLAAAALLIEMTRADHQRDDVEMQAVLRALKRSYSYDDEQLATLLDLAEAEAADMTSYHEFSSLIKNGFSYEDRVRVIAMLWEVAFADGRIDHHEEHLVRKIAGLLYVRREDIVAAKSLAIQHHEHHIGDKT
ncbi:MAG: TerB family tellurite resistance protein [Gammaproteobacteria bacterium]|nr:TerB family tellurite resistance protein [Gammaproteobacteria bacterium]